MDEVAILEVSRGKVEALFQWSVARGSTVERVLIPGF